MIGLFLKLYKKLYYYYIYNKPLKNIMIGNSILLKSFKVSGKGSGQVRIKIGNDSMIGCNIIFESFSGEITIGDRVFIGNSNLICRTKIEFENDIFVAWGTYFYDHDSHSLDYRERQKDIQQQIRDYREGRDFITNKDWSVVNSKPIHICSNAWIGINCIILKGVTIGEGAIVAAGSVVTKDVPAWTVFAGNPAKVVKELEIRK